MTSVATLPPPETTPDAPPATSEPTLVSRLFQVVGGFGFAAVLLVLLTLVTWLGTLYQVEAGLYDAQKKYFDSLVLVHRWWKIGIPLLGGQLLLWLLCINLIVGGVLRMRKSRATIGILIAHLGILLLLAAGFVKFFFSTDGITYLAERDLPGFAETSASYYTSYYHVELVVHEELEGGKVREHIVPWRDIEGMRRDERRRFTSAALPFDVELVGYARHARVDRASEGSHAHGGQGPVVDGFRLDALPPSSEAERNMPGAYAFLHEKSGGRMHQAILWAADLNGLKDRPHTLEVDGKRWGVELRHERYPLPFTLELVKATRVDHPRTTMAKAYSSDVIVVDREGRRPVKIEMNAPLRYGGYVLFQSQMSPMPTEAGTVLTSGLATVRNPSDHWPTIACGIIALGLLIHFLGKLFRYIRSEQARLS